ncbi:hypothetical protein FACS1894137_06870 [Spirochaetia bacterium]|nr:hypothetical protein FACS1894137_06870 [Spirochaetia bacterium]
MANLHIIGIGGTGHKVISACVHLTACGAFKGTLGGEQIDSIRILTVDADDANGNLTETKQTITAYQNFFKAVGSSKKLELVEVNLTHIRLCTEKDKSIMNAFAIPKYADSYTKEFINFLYSEKEVNLEFNQGFYGHTSVGSLMVEEVLSTDAGTWRNYLSGISTNDFVFIVGSFFGGTGASAIPVIIQKLKEKKQITNFQYAALMLTPYFNTIGDITKEGSLPPNSENFHVKAKASLFYYNKLKRYEHMDAFYVIGEPVNNFSNEAAHIGAAPQKNKPHPIELFAATAVIDFIKEKDNRKSHEIITASREKEGSGDFCWTWKMLENIDTGLPQKIQNFMKVAVLYNKVLYNQIQNPKGVGWLGKYDKTLTSEKDDNRLKYENIHEYTKSFVMWMYDLHKKNTEEFDQSGELKWEYDSRVKFFEARYENLFDNKPLNDSKIENYAELIYTDKNDFRPRKSEQIYNDLATKDPESTGAVLFPELFDMLVKFVDEPYKPGLLERARKPKEEKFTFESYLSQYNGINLNDIGQSQGHLWAANQPEILLQIGQGLPYTMSKEFKINDISIPSPWFVFLINELILTDKAKSKGDFVPTFAPALVDMSYNQWCGLIALLALRKIRLYENDGLKLECKALDAGTFVDAVSKFATDNTYLYVNQNNQDSWKEFSKISIGGETIGALSINTIVCPAFSISLDAKEKLHKIAPTIVNDKGEFQSPENYYADPANQVHKDAKSALLDFLDVLFKEITKEQKKTDPLDPSKPANPNIGLIATFQALIKDFQRDLLKSGAQLKNTAIQIPTPNSADAISTVQDLFNKIVPIIISPQQKPFILKDARKKTEDGHLEVALIGLDICGISSSDSRAATIFITDKLLYSKITQDNAREKSGNPEDGIYLLYDKDLLLDTMVVINKKDNPAFPEIAKSNTQISNYEIIWPVSRELLVLYNSAELSQMLSARRKDDKIIVTLSLKLANEKTHIVEKEYRLLSSDSQEKRKNSTCYVLDQRQLPFLGIWPYAEILDMSGRNTWKIYSYFYDELKAGKIRMKSTPVFCNNKVTESSPSKLLISDPQRDVFYKKFTELPYAITFDLIEDDIESEAGAILLSSPKPYPANGMCWNIGLDFGTTSTTAFYAKSGDNPEFLHLLSEYGWKAGKKSPDQELPHKQLDNGVRALVNSGSAGGEDNFKYFFIDDKCLDQNSYITTYEVTNNTNSDSSDEIFESGRVFWHNFDNFALFNSREGRRDNLKTNIKWDTNIAFIGKYLKQMVTQMVYAAAVEGIRTINWYFSYPTAFSGNDIEKFENTLKKLTEEISKDTGVEILFDGTPNMITESVAAAYYFRKDNDRQDTFLCIDIGGGTSDISIWNEDSNLFQSSIRFASRDMFIAPLSTLLLQKGIMDTVQGTEAEDGIHAMLTECSKDVSKKSNERIKFFIETVLFEYFETFRDRLGKLEGEGASYYNKFKYCVFIAYTGLMYYVGNIICAMLTTIESEKKIDSSRAEIVYGLSGKGSKLTIWIKIHREKIHEAIEALILNKTGVKITLKFSFEEKYAKTETAKGLICNLDPSGKQQDKAKLAKPEVFFGNSITLIKNNIRKDYVKDSFVRKYGDDEYIQDTKDTTFELDKELNDFDEFLEFFNRLAPETEGDMPKIDLKWYKEKRNVLYGRLEKDFKSIFKEGRFEAPFIVILKGFLKDYSEEYLYAKV